MVGRSRPLFALAALVLVGGLVLLGSGPAYTAPPGDKDVRVINTTAEAVPTIAQGTTAVSGTVAAQQSGPWSVGLAGTPLVLVENDSDKPLQIRDVDNPARHAYQKEVKITVDPGLEGQNAIVDVPAGKIFVIEQVSALGTVPAGQHLLFSLLTHIAPDLTSREHLLETRPIDFGAANTFTVSQLVRIYADSPGAIARVDRDSAAGTAQARFVVSGYMLDK